MRQTPKVDPTRAGTEWAPKVAPDSEKRILALLLGGEPFDDVYHEGLRPEHFAEPSRGRLYELMCSARTGEAVTVLEKIGLTITSEDPRAEAVVKLMTEEAHVWDRGAYVQNILEAWEARDREARAQKVAEAVYNGDDEAAAEALGVGGNGSGPDVQGDPLSDREHLSLKYPADDDGNAEFCRDLFGERVSYSEQMGWMHYADNRWSRSNASVKIEGNISTLLRIRFTGAVKAERAAPFKTAVRPNMRNVRNARARLASYPEVVAGPERFDSHRNLLNVLNGTLNLETGEVQDHDPADMITHVAPVEYDGDVDFSEWGDWVRDVLGSDDLALYLQKCVGYSLTGHTWEEILFYIYGPPRSGKGTFTESLIAMMGYKPLAVEMDFSTVTRDRSNDSNSADLASLKGCRFVAASESTTQHWLRTDVIKRVTGGNSLTVAYKFQDHFTYRPEFKIWLSSNVPPQMDPTDKAAWSRLRVLQFPKSHLGQENKRLKQHMRSPEMLQQILTWAVQGSMMWYASGSRGLEYPLAVERMTEQSRADLDEVAQWIEDKVDPVPDGEPAERRFTSAAVLYKSYAEWCKVQGVERHKQKKGLAQDLRSKGYKAARSYIPTGSVGYKQGRPTGQQGTQQVRGFYGVTLSDQQLNYD